MSILAQPLFLINEDHTNIYKKLVSRFENNALTKNHVFEAFTQRGFQPTNLSLLYICIPVVLDEKYCNQIRQEFVSPQQYYAFVFGALCGQINIEMYKFLLNEFGIKDCFFATLTKDFIPSAQDSGQGLDSLIFNLFE